MAKKFRKILIIVLVVVFAATMICLAATNARYVSSPSPTNATNELVYTLSDQCVVEDQEELESAIKNETQNIKLGGDEDTPFYVNTDDLELAADLILDLNGHEVMCITRDPILTVGTDPDNNYTPYRLLVTDTSASQTGSFYNPVGSVLSVEGGVVTTSGGKYESGPRKTEYFSNLAASDYTGGKILSIGSVSVTYQRDSSGVTQSSTSAAYMPLIAPNTESGVITGNIYFDTEYSSGSCTIPADTYLYFISTDFESSPTLANPSKADFYYTYYLKDDGSGNYTYYTDETAAANAGASAVVVCGYYNDKTVAADTDSTLNTNMLGRSVSNFAAIKMQYGDIYVRGGNFYSWFGKSTAYCISATGASGTVSSDTAVYDGYFEAIEEGVCVRCAYDVNTPTLAIYDGDFYSYKGDMVQIERGNMTVTGGTFTKDTTASEYNKAQSAGANNSAIYIKGGTMTVTGTADAPVQIYLYGPAMDGIKCENYDTSNTGSITAEYAVFTYNDGSAVTGTTTYGYNVGIANYGGTVAVTSCLFDTNDSDSIGIKSESGTLTASGCNFVLSGADATGIKADGGTVSIGDASNVSTTICMFYIDHVYNCYGIYSDTSTLVTLNINAAQFIMGQRYYSTETSYNGTSGSGDYSTGTFVSAGIYMNATATGSAINLKRAVFMMAGNYSAGVFAENGTITQDDGSNDYTTALLIGVTHAGYDGNGICNSNYTSNFSENKFGNSYFVALYGTNTSYPYTAASSTNYYTSGTSLNTLSSQFTGLSATGTAIGSYGIYSGGGTIEVEKTYIALCSTYGSGIYTEGGTMTIADFECDVRSTDSTVTAYPGTGTSADVSSSAIASGTGGSSASITITKSNINTDAFGYNVQSGALIFAGANTLNSVRATAIYINGASLTINSAATLTLTSTIATSAGWTDPSGTLLTEYSSGSAVSINPDGIYVSGGSFTSNGTLNVTFAGVNNNTSVSYFVDFVIASYAVKVTGDSSPEVTIAKGAITSSIGGGVEVDASGATVTLGESSAANTALTVTTTGSGTAVTGANSSVLTAYDADRTITTTGSWGYYLYPQSGHAVKVDNGTLTINSGTYSATQGNGIFVNGTSSNVSIYDGSFVGKEVSLGSYVGPTISYGLKLFSGNMYVYGGTFGENLTNAASNGVFIMGTSAAVAGTYTCNAYLYGGYYYGGTGRAVSLMGYCYTQIGTTDANVYSGTSPTISGAVYGVGLEPFDNNANYSYEGSFEMYAGTITASSQDGIWIGNTNYTVTIAGATVSNDTYGVNIYGYDNGINFYRVFYGAISITNAKIYGDGDGIEFAGTLSNTLTVTDSLIYSTSQYGIYFKSTISSAVTLTGSTIYGGSGICFATDPGSVSFTISGCSVYSNTSWNALEFAGNSSLALVINSSSTITGGSNNATDSYNGHYYSIRIDDDLTGSITVSGNSTVTSSRSYAIYVGGTFSSTITVGSDNDNDSTNVTGAASVTIQQGGSTTYSNVDIYVASCSSGAAIYEYSSQYTYNNTALLVRLNSGNSNNISKNNYVTIITGNAR